MAQAGLELSQLEPGDLGEILALHAEVYILERGYPAVFELYVLQALAGFMANFNAEDDLFLVIRRQRNLVGSVALKRLAATTAQLRFLILSGCIRGQGAGAELFNAARQHAVARGCRELVLETASDLTAARAIYEGHGLRRRSNAPAVWLPDGVMSELWGGPLSR